MCYFVITQNLQINCEVTWYLECARWRNLFSEIFILIIAVIGYG